MKKRKKGFDEPWFAQLPSKTSIIRGRYFISEERVHRSEGCNSSTKSSLLIDREYSFWTSDFRKLSRLSVLLIMRKRNHAYQIMIRYDVIRLCLNAEKRNNSESTIIAQDYFRKTWSKINRSELISTRVSMNLQLAWNMRLCRWNYYFLSVLSLWKICILWHLH